MITDKRRRERTLGAAQSSVNIHRVIDGAAQQESCSRFAAFKMPLAFSTYVRMMMYR